MHVQFVFLGSAGQTLKSQFICCFNVKLNVERIKTTGKIVMCFRLAGVAKSCLQCVMKVLNSLVWSLYCSRACGFGRFGHGIAVAVGTAKVCKMGYKHYLAILKLSPKLQILIFNIWHACDHGLGNSQEIILL